MNRAVPREIRSNSPDAHSVRNTATSNTVETAAEHIGQEFHMNEHSNATSLIYADKFAALNLLLQQRTAANIKSWFAARK